MSKIMKIRKEWDYPPYPFLEQVLSHCPKAGWTYLFLWKERDAFDCLRIKKLDIPAKTLMSRISFDANMRNLCREGLVSAYQTDDDLQIELVRWEDE